MPSEASGRIVAGLFIRAGMILSFRYWRFPWMLLHPGKAITMFSTSRCDLDGGACATLQSRVFVSLSHRAGFPRHKDDEMRGKNVTGGQS